MTADQILDDLLRREGWPKVTNRESDRGGLTKGGVTFRSYNAWRGQHGERALTPEEFALITEPEARTFFADEFFRPLAFVGDEGIYVLLADWAVHAGVAAPVRALQQQLATRGLYAGRIDGVPGAGTKAGWAQIARDLPACAALECDLIKARGQFYLAIAFDAQAREFLRAHPATQLHNLEGWMHRLFEFITP